jgi:predicted nucleotidyltransferase
MARDWEVWLATASGPASATEENERDRTEKRIREAIRASSEISPSVRVFAKGSYANGTNVRRNADVDIAVEYHETIKVGKWGKTEGATPTQLGYSPVDFGVTTGEFRLQVERALRASFGVKVDIAPDKHIGVEAGNGTLDADVVPCFALHRYDTLTPPTYVAGHRIYPKSGGHVDNYPQQNYDNGVAKNRATGRRYKELVRCTKRLIIELYEEKEIKREYPGYLTECLLYNVPNDRFGNTRRYDDLQSIFRFLWNALDDEEQYEAWTEPSRLIMLFRGHSNRYPASAKSVIGKAWDKIGVV